MSCPDLSSFVRANQEAPLRLFQASSRFEAFVQQTLRHPNPSTVPLSVLRSMDDHPMVYLAERTVTGVLRRPDLYYVRHPDPAIKAEVEEWLWPLLPQILGSIARAYAYGAIPVVFNWCKEDLWVKDQLVSGHVHYATAHELWPGEVEIDSRNDALTAIRYGKRRFSAERAALFVWDREFGGWRGKSARRRAWTDYCRSLSAELLQLRYPERSVDPIRVARAPGGFVHVDGQDADALDHINRLTTQLSGGGSLALPSDRDEKGNFLYEVDHLETADRQGVWERALNRYDAGILRAYLVPPGLGGLEDVAAAGARTLDGMLKEFVQDLAQFAADELTKIVTTVHRYNHSERHVPAPEVLAYEVPASVRKLYLEVLRLVSAAGREEAPADWVDVPALLDQLGVPLRSEPLAPIPRGGRRGGRPRDLIGGREARREAARTDAGEDATGRRGGNPYDA
ncbi:MAG: hypothetical protein JKY65_32175 [Planctomycetes bacterium]|nr:hypothetical protein [Planctomycetota bacterium]